MTEGNKGMSHAKAKAAGKKASETRRKESLSFSRVRLIKNMGNLFQKKNINYCQNT